MQNPFDPGYYTSAELRTFGFKSIGENVQIAKTCKIVGLHNIEIGDNSRVDDFTTLIATGPLTIGSRVHIHSYCQVGARGGVTFEDFTNLASGCLVFSASDDPLGRYMAGGVSPEHCTKPKVAPVRFCRHSTAYVRCTVLPGVTLGEGSIVCPQSVVGRDLPAWMIARGNPAVARIPRPRNVLALEASIAELERAA